VQAAVTSYADLSNGKYTNWGTAMFVRSRASEMWK